MQSLLSETLTLSETDKKILKDLFTRFQKLTEIRNDHLHATIFVGWGSDPTDDFSQASMMKFHKDQKGAALKSSQVTSNLIDAHTKEAAALAGLFHRLIGCCAAGLSIEKNFTINSNGHACDPKQPCE